jgi:EAL domain-containing protein (putative c-di-GMP-specific phosphodiesterase class I)/CHASE2 domain-containing sensor protein
VGEPAEGFHFDNLSWAMPRCSYSTERVQVPWRKKEKPHKSPVKLLAWTTLLGFVFGLIGFGQIAEDWMRTLRNGLHPHKASGDIVLVTIDDASLREVGRWPWPRRKHAEIIDHLSAAGANRIFFDFSLAYRTNHADDSLLAEAIARSGNVVLPVIVSSTPKAEGSASTPPLAAFAKHAALGTVAVNYNYQNSVWQLPYSTRVAGKALPSFSAMLAGVEKDDGFYTIDYSAQFQSIPTLSAQQVLSGSYPKQAVRGKDVIIGIMSDALGDRFFLPGHGQTGGVYIHLLGAETLKSGAPRNLGWLPAFLISLAISAYGALRLPGTRQNLIFGTWTAALLGAPVLFEANLVTVDIAPALLVTLSTWSTLAWRRYRRGGITNPVSGLPNLTALHSFRSARDQGLVVARILNFADVIATLPSGAEKSLVDQIVSRLCVGAPGKIIYQGDGGIFAWFDRSNAPFGHHIEALHALFRNAVRIGDVQVDLTITFGVEIGCGRSIANRLASALVAAEEAAHDGLRWKIHDPEKLQDASWRLSILTQLDQAIDNGQVWVAYQPKLDLGTRTIIGAEALARWTHPEKGPIAATEFIAAAEQHDRIHKLSDFVLEQAIAAAAQVNAAGREFHIAVNLSARLLSDSNLKTRLSAMLLKHLLDPELLTLELTETSSITSKDALKSLAELRDLGVQISIDDYGTGLSTLDYLKKIPAKELKIDQSFVRGLLDNRSDRVMVQSTIALAHSLNRIVVAEGVESDEVLNALAEMKCDVAQGFIIGRPMSFNSLRRRLTVESRRSVA